MIIKLEWSYGCEQQDKQKLRLACAPWCFRKEWS